MSNRNPVVISIEGNIGSGKSTLFRALQNRNPTWHFVPEPVDMWLQMKNDEGESLLELFYANKQRWSYTFQNTALLTRVKILKDTIADWEAAGRPGSNIFITERSILTDKNVFAISLFEEGAMNKLEMDLYNQWYGMVADSIPMPSAFVYVWARPEICDGRIHGRAREGEERIPLDYLRQLDNRHEAWLRYDPLGMKVYECHNNEERRASDDFGVLEPRENFTFPLGPLETWIHGINPEQGRT